MGTPGTVPTKKRRHRQFFIVIRHRRFLGFTSDFYSNTADFFIHPSIVILTISPGSQRHYTFFPGMNPINNSMREKKIFIQSIQISVVYWGSLQQTGGVCGRGC